jgi:hypothetical protein
MPLIGLKSLARCTSLGPELRLQAADGRRLVLYAKSELDAEAWRDKIVDFVPAPIVTNLHPERSNAKFGVGDIILFRIETFGAGAQRVFTNSEFDHTGVVVPITFGVSFSFGNTKEEGWALLEATPQGVITCPLAARLSQYHADSRARMAVRHLVKKESGRSIAPKAENIEDLRHLVVCSAGAPYSYRKMLKTPVENFTYDRAAQEIESTEGYFCSQLCAIALSSLGAMNSSKMYHPNSYWPKSFMSGQDVDEHLDDDFLLMPELEIDVRGISCE